MDDYHQLIADAVTAHSEHLNRPIDYIEVGVLTGNSADAVLATGKIRNAVLVDIFSDPTYNAYEPSAAKVRERLKRYDGKFKVIEGDSRKVVPQITEQFDVGFVDGDHTTHGCRVDLANIFHLLREEGIIFVDDMSFPGLKYVTEHFASENRLQFKYHEVHNGLGEIRKV